ncbi:MAG: S9 family peptidase [Bacteroidales bacterium]|nr:S9 family peptidase [Bacteroidales bacterium]MDD3151318.1 S9 family peptidase [Bacteroidales bacterium]MDD3913666.1 S9 family peptidase [Bacteroidales bacterium]MDD4633917.1 S9 family peptidase [Bacteroidales bacterium]
MKKILLSLIISLLILSEFSQSIIIEQYKIAGPYSIYEPFIIDSINPKGEKFSDKKLLQTPISFNKAMQNGKIAEADSSGKIVLDKISGENIFYLLSFHINPKRFTKGTLNVSGSGIFEVYINGESKKDKTKNDTLQNVKVDLSLQPNDYEIIIKYVITDDAKDEMSFSAFLDIDEAEKVSISSDFQRYYTIYNLQDSKNLRGVSISSGGRYALVQFSERVAEKNEYYTRLIDLKEDKILYKDNDVLNSASWLPNREKLYFTREGMEGRELVFLDPVNFEESIIETQLPEGSFDITPDEKKLIFSIKEESPKSEKDLKRILDPSDRQENWRSRYNISIYDLESGILESITFGHTSAWVNDISKDSKYILFSTSNVDYTKRPFSTTNLYRYDISSRTIDTILYDATYVDGGTFSPDGKQLLLIGGPEAFDKTGLNIGDEVIGNSYDNQLFIFDLEKKTVRAITKDFNPSITSAVWSSYNNKIYVLAEDCDYQRIYSMDTRTNRFELFNIPEDLIKSFSISTGSSVLLCYGQSVSNADRLYSYNLKSKEVKCLYDLSTEKTRGLILGETGDWNFTSSDGTTITGRFYLPPDFDSTKKYPMLVYYYGGTSPTTRAMEFTYSMHLFASQGYVVYTLNPSGTTGFGQEFSARHVNAWGKRTADEIILGTKLFYREHSYIDSTKVGCFGASYGGFMTQYLQTQTDIFAAAVSHAGISSITSYWGEGYWGIGYCSVANADSYPWNNPELFVEQSPLFNADKIKTPLLLLHGNKDTNVPIGESIQMYNALKILGRPVEFIIVDGENHGISEYNKRIKWHQTMSAWFSKWLMGDNSWWEAMYSDLNL